MKALIGTDLEGVAGVVSFTQQTYGDSRYYDRAKRLLTAEVNAAVEGLLGVGVDDILVMDGHGPGGMWFEELHPAAKLLHGRPLPPRKRLVPIVSQYDVCLMIGQHAMAGVLTSNQGHTQSSRAIDHIRLNGQEIGEIAQFALYYGGLGLPLIFLSGEQAACEEVEALIPGIETVAVQQGVGRGAAISLAAPEAHRRIRDGIRRAVQRQRSHPHRPLIWEGPYVLEKRFFHTDAADRASVLAGAERVDSQTVRYRSEDILETVYW
jgi:D-amino peptidase